MRLDRLGRAWLPDDGFRSDLLIGCRAQTEAAGSFASIPFKQNRCSTGAVSVSGAVSRARRGAVARIDNPAFSRNRSSTRAVSLERAKKHEANGIDSLTPGSTRFSTEALPSSRTKKRAASRIGNASFGQRRSSGRDDSVSRTRATKPGACRVGRAGGSARKRDRTIFPRCGNMELAGQK